MSTKKVIFVGNSKTGKTHVVKELCGITSQNVKYIPTLGVEVHPYVIPSTNTAYPKCFNIWDCAGDARYKGLNEKYYVDADIAIIFTGGDGGNNHTECGNISSSEYLNRVKNVCPSSKIHVVNNPSANTIINILKSH